MLDTDVFSTELESVTDIELYSEAHKTDKTKLNKKATCVCLFVLLCIFDVCDVYLLWVCVYIKVCVSVRLCLCSWDDYCVLYICSCANHDCVFVYLWCYCYALIVVIVYLCVCYCALDCFFNIICVCHLLRIFVCMVLFYIYYKHDIY